jgi:hypothetical protein
VDNRYVDVEKRICRAISSVLIMAVINMWDASESSGCAGLGDDLAALLARRFTTLLPLGLIKRLAAPAAIDVRP